jgi:hypothetical protein
VIAFGTAGAIAEIAHKIHQTRRASRPGTLFEMILGDDPAAGPQRIGKQRAAIAPDTVNSPPPMSTH